MIAEDDVNLDSMLVSVGRTWRFDTGGQTGVDLTRTGYATKINWLKGTNDQPDFRLPWPPYRSRFWEYMLSASYRETDTDDLASVLLPLRYWRFLVVPNELGAHPRIEIEAIRHPFALTTIAHFRMQDRDPRPPGDQAAELLKTLLYGNLGVMQPVDGAFPYKELPSLPTIDVMGKPIVLKSGGNFVLISALHRDPDALLAASALARRFPQNPPPAESVAIQDGAVNVHADTVGLAVSAQVGARLAGCLHNNYSLLLAYLQNLATLVGSSPTSECKWFQERAALMLNHVYRREPVPPVNAMYKSRLADLWLSERGLIEPINKLAANLALGLPPLQVPGHPQATPAPSSSTNSTSGAATKPSSPSS
jgi:hypothetical protein